MEPFVSANWLELHRNDVAVADVRWYLDGRLGHESYVTGHIPGAVFVDLEVWLAGAPTPQSGRHPLPSPEQFAKGMSELGIGDSTSVVAYDDAGGVIAARLVWMLRVTGHDAAVLDGGIAAFKGELMSGAIESEPASFTVRAWPEERFASIDETANGEWVVVDA
ncbi:MAG: rhodanese-like domain-containing protein, partial [Acidimicrobiales bacterium]